MKTIYERLERKLVKEFENYKLYQIYGVIEEQKIPLYKVCE